MMEKIHFTTTGMLLISVLFMACGENRDASKDTADSLKQQVEGDGVPLNNLERSHDTDTTDQPRDNTSGVPLDNLNREEQDELSDDPLNM